MTARTLRVFAGLLTFIPALAPVMAQPGTCVPVAISIPPVTASAGSETNVSINVRTGGAGIGALQFDLAYDPAVLEAVKVDPGRLLSGLTDFNITSPGRIRVALATSEGIAGEGEILVATFRGVREGESSLRIENARAWEQATSFETTVQADPGVVTVEAPSSFPTVAVVAGVVVLVGLLLLLAIVAIVVFRRKRKAVAQTYAPAMTNAPAWPPVPVNPVPWPPPASVRCPSCGTQASPGARFCRTCGKPVG